MSCLGLRRTQGEDGTWNLPANRIIYKSFDFSPIDIFPMLSALMYLERAASVYNSLVRESLVHETDMHRQARANYRPPISLLTMNE